MSDVRPPTLEPLDAQLEALSSPALSSAARDRAWWRARQVLLAPARVPPPPSWVERIYARLEPTVVLAVVVIDVAWTLAVIGH
jgi:hypothetical protein